MALALPLIAPIAERSDNETLRKGTNLEQQKYSARASSARLSQTRRDGAGVWLFVVVLLWFGFTTDYATTRDIYFTVAIAHVLAEAPFLLKML